MALSEKKTEARNQKIIAFKVWYSSNTATGQSYEEWIALPDDDIQQVIIYYKPKNENTVPDRQITTGFDYYALDENLDLTSSDNKKDLIGHIKLGKWTSDENIERILDEANEAYAEGWLWYETGKRGISMKEKGNR